MDEKIVYVLMAVLFIIIVALVIILIIAFKKRNWHTHCAKCGFKFLANESQCPECGSNRLIRLK